MTKKILPILLATSFMLLPVAADAFQILPCNPLKAYTDFGGAANSEEAGSAAVNDCDLESLGTLLVNIFNWLLGLAGLVAFLFIIWGGLQMLLGWFYEQPEGAWKDGVLTIRRAIFGFVLVAAAFFVVNTLLTGILGVEGLNTFFQKLFS